MAVTYTNRALLFLLSATCVLSLQSSSVKSEGAEMSTETRRLCDMGCECPKYEQSPAVLDCSRRGFTDLPPSLRFERPLAALHFQGNALASLGPTSFSRAEAVELLDLSFNRIQSVGNLTFVPFRTLTKLKMSHNRLSELTEGLLEGLSGLRVLEVGHNAIRRLSPEAFRSTPHLQELRMQSNPVFYLPEHTFQFLRGLEKLDLEDTGLAMLPEAAFSGTPRLRWLSLAANALEKVPEEALSRASLLDSLDLSGNDFTSLERGDFRRLSRVSSLRLNRLPRLGRVERDSLLGLASLKTLWCSYNPRLAHFDRAAFGSANTSRATPPREQLYLRQNALRTLRSPLDSESWSSLSFVDLADNPWKCDCDLLWMTSQLKADTQMNIVCDSPGRLRGTPLAAIDPGDLRCEDRWSLVVYVSVSAALVSLGLVAVGATAVVCSRSRAGLIVRARRQFSYARVTKPPLEAKPEVVDLEWDPSADLQF